MAVHLELLLNGGGLFVHLNFFTCSTQMIGEYGIAGCSGSNKEATVKNKGINEDRFVVEPLLQDFMFIGIFDGHGGDGASSFLVDHLMQHVESAMEECTSGENIGNAIQDGFINADRDLFLAVQSLGEEYRHLRESTCKCAFYRELPCRCLKAPRSAHEGSTATVLLVSSDKLYCANVGDSEAILVTKSGTVVSSQPIDGVTTSSLRKVTHGRRETMTVIDTPIPDAKNADYLRVKHIAETRLKNVRGRGSRTDGIRRGPSHRFNYVALEGAHSLNMTRAFGNFGHKEFTQDNPAINIENQSPIIARPHIRIYESASEDDFLFAVVGSDGLWDNISKEEVVQIVKSYCIEKLTGDVEVSKVQLAALADGASELLLEKSLKRNQKLDDITLVVVIFQGILNLIPKTENNNQ